MNLRENRLTRYFLESKEELGKVTWPSQKELINQTLLVIGMSVIFALFFGGLDLLFTWIMQTTLLK